MTGRAVRPDVGDEIIVLKLAAANGNVLWDEFIGGPGGLDDRGWDIAVGPDDHPVVTGIIVNSDETADFITFKLNSADGSTVWSRSAPDAVNNPFSPAGWLAICDNGDVVMANRTWNVSSSYDVVLERFAAGNGATEWDLSYDSPNSNPDNPYRMCRDSAGDLLVVGVTGSDYMVLKFDHTDGELIWSAQYDGPPSWYDTAKCVTEGPNGEVIVSGFSDGTGTSWDVATLALDPADGSQLWVARYDTGDGEADEAAAVLVSPTGDIYVVGYGYRQDTNSDILALRYYADPVSDAATDPLTARALSVWPNPSGRQVEIRFTLPRAGSARLHAYDATGRCVSLQQPRSLDAGRQRLVWDGRDLLGRPLNAGVYLVRIDAGSFTSTRSVLLIR